MTFVTAIGLIPSRFVLRGRLMSGIVRPCPPATISRDL